MTGEETKILLEIRDRTNRIEQRLEDRDRQCQIHAQTIGLLDERVDQIERKMSGLRAWISAAGLFGGVIGWIAHHVMPSIAGK